MYLQFLHKCISLVLMKDFESGSFVIHQQTTGFMQGMQTIVEENNYRILYDS